MQPPRPSREYQQLHLCEILNITIKVHHHIIIVHIFMRSEDTENQEDSAKSFSRIAVILNATKNGSLRRHLQLMMLMVMLAVVTAAAAAGVR